MNRIPRPAGIASFILVVATGTLLAQPAEPEAMSRLIERGRYVVQLGGCNDCHTPGYAESGGTLPQSQWLTGSPLGHRGPWGTTYATNLRSYFQGRSADQWVATARAIKTRPPMPWFVLHQISESDLRAMHAFVSSLGPASGVSATYLPPGQEPKPPYVAYPMPAPLR
jgi:mono/diheme cytochrome c family protein